MKKYGLFLFIFVCLFVWDQFRETNSIFGKKAEQEEFNNCSTSCEILKSCGANTNNPTINQDTAKMACEILCHKQITLFKVCESAIRNSCTSAENCFTKELRGFY